MMVKTIFSGSGGQGVLMMGLFLKIIGLIPPGIYLNSLKTLLESKKKPIIDTN